MNFLDNTPNQSTKFRTKHWVEINDDSREKYNTNSQINFKTSMLRLILCDYGDKYKLVSGTITVAALAAGTGNNNIQVVLKNCAPFTNFINKINNTQIDNAQDIDVVIAMYNLIECSDNHSKTSGSLQQYCRDKKNLTDAGAFNDFSGNNASFKFKQKTTSSTGNNSTQAVQIIIPFKYLSIFLRALEISLINFETNLILSWSPNCVISNSAANQGTKFTITDIKRYHPVVTFSTEDNIKLLQQLKPGFKRTIN